MKIGVRTSEFWLTLTALVSATVLRITHDITPDAWTTIATVATTGYVLGRSAVKVGSVQQ